MKHYKLLKQVINNRGYCSIDKRNMDIIEKEIRVDEKRKTIEEVLNELEELKQNFKNDRNIHEAIAVNISIKRINQILANIQMTEHHSSEENRSIE